MMFVPVQGMLWHNQGMDKTEHTTDETQYCAGDPRHTTDETQAGAEKRQSVPQEEYVETEVDLGELPRINWGALLMPAIWGPAHGQWITIFFYPLWLLTDTCLTNAVLYGGVAIALAIPVILGTAAVTLWYACTAGRKAYLRVASRMTMQEYLKSERKWVVISALIALVFIGLATWYNLAVRIPEGLAT